MPRFDIPCGPIVQGVIRNSTGAALIILGAPRLEMAPRAPTAAPNAKSATTKPICSLYSTNLHGNEPISEPITNSVVSSAWGVAHHPIWLSRPGSPESIFGWQTAIREEVFDRRTWKPHRQTGETNSLTQ